MTRDDIPDLSNADVIAFGARHGVEALVAPDEDGIPRVWVDEDALRTLADNSPFGPVAGNAIADQILTACREGRVWNG